GGVDVAAAVEDDRLDVGPDGVVDRGMDDVVALVGILGDRVAGRVDEIDVVAGAADHHVVAAPAVKGVVAGVAGQRVVVGGAGGVDVAAAVEDDGLDVGADRIVDRGMDDVVALVGVLRDHVAGIVDHIGVVAGAPLHDVGAGPAIERVVAGVAGEKVGRTVAG